MLISPLLVVCLASIVINANPVELVFPKSNPKTYNSYLWPNEEKLLVIPKLEAKTTINSATEKICGFKIISSDYEQYFKVSINDPVYGFGEVLVNNHEELSKKNVDRILLQIEAYDCDPNPHVSERANMIVNILKESGSIFSEKEYNFAISEYAPKHSIVGYVNVLNEPRANSVFNSNNCGFQITPIAAQGQQFLPITIDLNGLLRTTESVVGKTLVKALVETNPCNPEERTVSAVINVKIVPQQCQPGWTDLPNYVEYDKPVTSPGFLFWPGNPILSTCWKTCLDPKIKVSVDLTDGLGQKDSIEYADSSNCQHDPKALDVQRKICGINSRTNNFVLPDPNKDLASQISSLTIGSLPTLNSHILTWRFEASQKQIWPVALDTLQGYDKKFAQNTFMKDFAITFWMKRSILTPNKEAILAFSDMNNDHLAFVVGLVSRELVVSQQKRGFLNTWSAHLDESIDLEDWHHFSVEYGQHKINHLIILVDGEPLGVSYQTETNDRIVDEFGSFVMTVGAGVRKRQPIDCFNGELTGFTLLLEERESMARLTCLAKCGESLLLPNAERLIESDTVVDLKSNKISFSGHNVTHMAALLTNIVYSRADPMQKSNSFENRIPKSRKIFIHTDFECMDNEVIDIPLLEIDLIVQALNPIHNREQSIWRQQNEEKQHVKINKKDVLLEFKSNEILLVHQPIDVKGYEPFLDAHFDSDQTKDLNSLVLNECLISPIDQNGFDEDLGERLIFEKDFNTRLIYSTDRFGVTIKKQDSIGEYLRIIRKLRYYLPENLGLRKPIGDGILYSQSINVVCSLDNGNILTPLFTKKIIVLTNDNLKRIVKAPILSQPEKDELEDFKDFLQDEPLNDEPVILNSLPNVQRIQQEKVLFDKTASSSTNISLIVSLSMASGLVLLLVGTALLYRKKGIEIDINRPISFSDSKKDYSLMNFRKFGDILKRYPSTKLTENPTYPVVMPMNNRSGLSPINIVPQTQMYELLTRKDSRLDEMQRSSFNGIYDDEFEADEEEDENFNASPRPFSSSDHESNFSSSNQSLPQVSTDNRKTSNASSNNRRIV